MDPTKNYSKEASPDVIKIVDETTGKVIFEGSRAFYRFEFNTMMCPEKGYTEYGTGRYTLYINGTKYVK